MADAFRGLTIRLGADARPLQSAISSITTAAGRAQKQLNAMNKALKFNPSNVGAMQAKLDLLSDKATLSARAFHEIKTAMQQVPSSIKSAANGTTEIYSRTQKLRAEYNHLNASIQKIHDSMIDVIQRGYGIKQNEAVEEFKRIREAAKGSGEEAKKAQEEWKEFFALASTDTKINEEFGQLRGDVKKLEATYDELHKARKKAFEGHEEAKAAEGFRAMRTQAIAWESAVQEAAADMARVKSDLFAIGSGNLNDIANDIKSMDHALDQVSVAAKKADAAFKEMPNSIEAAEARVLAFKAKEETLNQSIDTLKRKMKEIEATDGFDKVAASTRNVWLEAQKTERVLSNWEAQVKFVAEEIDQLEKKQKALDSRAENYTDEYNKLENQLKDLRDEYARVSAARDKAEDPARVARLQKEYREAGIEVQKLRSDLLSLDAASEKINAWGDRFRNIRTMGYGLYSTLTPAITMAGRYAVQAAEDIDSAYRDMRKTVQGSEEDFEKLKNDAVEYSTAHVTSAQEMLSIMAIGGQLGVTVDQLGNFSKVVSDLSIATDDAFDTESIALWLGKMQNVMHITSDDLDNFADSLVRLGNSEPALESDIANITSRFGAMGTVVGMLPDEILAIATAATATGQKAESSGGSLMRILGGIEVATSGVSQAMLDMANESEESAETLEAFEGAKERLSGYAEVADMTAESFANLWETDPTEAFSRVVEGLKRISDSGGSAVDAIKNLLGINNIRDIQLLLGLTQTVDKLDEMRGMSYNAFHGISDGFGDAGDAAREAEKKSQGFSGQMEILRNNARALGDALAEGAMPFVQMLSNMFQGLTSIVRGLPPELKSVIVLLGGLLAIAGPLTVAVGAVGSAVMSFRTMARNAIGAQTLKTAEANVRNLGKASTAAGKQAASASSGFRAFRTGAENAAASGTIIERGMSKASKGMNTIKSAASKAGAALSSIKGTLGFAAVLTAVDLVIDAFAKYLDHTRKVEIASRDVFNRMGIGVQQAADVAEEGSMRVAKALNFGEIKQMRHDWVESIADSFDMLQQKATDTFSNIGLAEHYSQIIEDLMKVADATPWATLNDEQQAQLTAAVEGYNAATGESITITNAEKAALADSAGQAIETAEAFDKLTEKKKASMVKDYLNEEYAETYKKAYEGAEQQAEAEQRLATIQAERAEIEANGIDYTDDSAVQYYKTLIEAEKQLTEEVDGYREQRELLNKTLEKTEQLEVLANKAASDSGTAIDRFMVSAQGLDISAFIAKNGQSITEFASALDSLGPKAQNLDHDQIFKLAQAWDGSLKSILPLLDQYKIGLDELQKKTIGGMEFYVTDNGSIYDMEGKLVEFDAFTIGDKTYYVDDQGTIYDETGKLDSFRTITIEDKTYMVTDDGTIYDQSGQIANFRDIQIDGKHYYVFDDGTIYENEKKLGVLNDLELIDKIFEASDNGTISIEIASIQGLISWINSVPDSHTTWFDGDTSLLEAAVESARNTVRSLMSRATTYIDAAQQAQGGLFLGTSIMRNARGGIVAIPRHASGSINGIVTRPTLTNVGLTGEAGAEAILHMRHAGGAIIPLSNRRYVRPFARAVASEIPSGNNGNVTNIYIGDVSYSENSREGQAVLELTRVLGMEV